MSMIGKVLQLVTLTIAIPSIGAAEAAERLDLNTVTAAQLRALPGIGPERAEMILRVRNKSGPFRSIEELIAIPASHDASSSASRECSSLIKSGLNRSAQTHRPRCTPARAPDA